MSSNTRLQLYMKIYYRFIFTQNQTFYEATSFISLRRVPLFPSWQHTIFSQAKQTAAWECLSPINSQRVNANAEKFINTLSKNPASVSNSCPRSHTVCPYMGPSPCSLFFFTAFFFQHSWWEWRLRGQGSRWPLTPVLLADNERTIEQGVLASKLCLFFFPSVPWVEKRAREATWWRDVHAPDRNSRWCFLADWQSVQGYWLSGIDSLFLVPFLSFNTLLQ